MPGLTSSQGHVLPAALGGFSRAGKASPALGHIQHHAGPPCEGRVTCWWPWGWKKKHRRPLQGHGRTRCHPLPHMRLTTVWVPGGPGYRRGHQGGLGARRKARRESCVPGRVLPPAPGFAPRFRLEPCGRGAGAEPNPKDPPRGQSQLGKSPPAHRTAPAHPPWQGRSPPRAAARTPSTPERSPGEPRADQHPGQRAGKSPQGLGGTPGALRTPGDGGEGGPSSPQTPSSWPWTPPRHGTPPL